MIPLLLCLPQTLVAALSVYDYVPSSLRSGAGGWSLDRRNDIPEVGYYDPLEYGGYMLTVSAPLSTFFLVPGGLLFWGSLSLDTGITPLGTREDVRSDG